MTNPDRFIKGTRIDDALLGNLPKFGGILGAVLRNGFKSSEFVLSLLAVVLVPLLSLAEPAIATWAISNGWVGGLVAAVYTAARSYVKATAAKNEVAASVIQMTTPQAPPMTLPVEGYGNLTAEQIRNLPPLGGGSGREL